MLPSSLVISLMYLILFSIQDLLKLYAFISYFNVLIEEHWIRLKSAAVFLLEFFFVTLAYETRTCPSKTYFLF